MSNQTNYSVKIADRRIYISSGETLLEAMENADIPCEYQCRQGYCGHCRMRLVQGKYSYRDTPLAYIRDGEILPCLAQIEADMEIAKVTE
ncbi:MAG: 2Fe-2S ferredoxin-like protein [Cardiobacteriaceae bacterium]|nr:2Fe-2S ferredoxin-like protein [Cardiobacteriaceae bacterium]